MKVLVILLLVVSSVLHPRYATAEKAHRKNLDKLYILSSEVISVTTPAPLDITKVQKKLGKNFKQRNLLEQLSQHGEVAVLHKNTVTAKGDSWRATHASESMEPVKLRDAGDRGTEPREWPAIQVDPGSEHTQFIYRVQCPDREADSGAVVLNVIAEFARASEKSSFRGISNTDSFRLAKRVTTSLGTPVVFGKLFRKDEQGNLEYVVLTVRVQEQ